jgi:hypothetical protein
MNRQYVLGRWTDGSYCILEEPIDDGRLSGLWNVVLTAPTQRPTHTPDRAPILSLLRGHNISTTSSFWKENKKVKCHVSSRVAPVDVYLGNTGVVRRATSRYVYVPCVLLGRVVSARSCLSPP